MEVLKNQISIDKKIAKESTQILVEGDIIVPDFKPDIESLLEVTANAYIDNKEIHNERINFKGDININILFLAKNDNNSIYNIETTYPINDFISIENIDKSMNIFTKCNVKNLDYKLINDRKVNFRIVLEIFYEVFGKESFEIVTEINEIPKEQLKKSNFNINKIICLKFDKFNIKDELAIPPGKPAIKEILSCNLNIVNKDIKVLNDKINILGNIKTDILYKSDEIGEIPIYFEQNIPFNGSIETEGTTDNMIADVFLNIQNKNIKVIENENNESKNIAIDIFVGCNIKITNEEEVEILEDAYILNKKIEITKNTENYSSFVCKNISQVQIKEMAKLTEDTPPILQVVKIYANPILDNFQILEDSLLAEGVLECNLLYITNDNNIPIYSYTSIVPFSQKIEANGTSPIDSDVSLNINLEYANVNMLSDKDFEIRGALNIEVAVFKQKNLPFIVDFAIEDMDEETLNNIGSMNIYVVQKGDTLWQLAKNFNTTINDIKELNNIEEDDFIYPGQKLLILKKVC